jgi:hypothetical protein
VASGTPLAHRALAVPETWSGSYDHGCALAPSLFLVTGEDDVPDLAGGAEDQHVPGGGVGPPPGQRSVQDQAQHTAVARMPSISVDLRPTLSDRIYTADRFLAPPGPS